MISKLQKQVKEIECLLKILLSIRSKNRYDGDESECCVYINIKAICQSVYRIRKLCYLINKNFFVDVKSLAVNE